MPQLRDVIIPILYLLERSLPDGISSHRTYFGTCVFMLSLFQIFLGHLFGTADVLIEQAESIIVGISKAPPRDADLPPKPKGQTVASFRSGLKMLPEAMETFLGPDVVKTGEIYVYRHRETFR